MHRVKTSAVSAALCAAIAISAIAQAPPVMTPVGQAPAVPNARPATPAQPAPAEPAPRFGESISVGYVMAPFAVTDKKGRAVTSLKADDVTLRVDGRPVVTDMFELAQNAPVSWTILLDGSGSMGLAGKMEGARIAMATLLGMRRQGDDFSLFVFAQDQIQEVVPFTTDPRRILDAMHQVKPYGKTAFFDALAMMPDKSLLGNNGSRAIILITDGLDNASKISREDLEASLEGVSCPVYPLTVRFPVKGELVENDEQGLDLQLLERIAAASGGRMAVETDAESLQKSVKAIEGDLRSQYLIGFTPTGKGVVKYRRFSLRLAKSSWTVRMRNGYKGTEPPYLIFRKR